MTEEEERELWENGDIKDLPYPFNLMAKLEPLTEKEKEFTQKVMSGEITKDNYKK